jgi:transmembrane sensor
MTQYDFDKLLEKYLQGNCTPQEELLLDEWSQKQMNNEIQVMGETEAPLIKKQLWKRIKQSAFPSPLSISWFSWAKLGIAASIVLAFSVVLYNGSVQKKSLFGGKEDTELTAVTITNTTNNPQTITLNDGTTVCLQPNSSLSHPEKFGGHNRIVYLKGEGFFNVKRDTTKPFYVYAGDLVTEVLGTSFTVKSFEKDKTAEVIVVSGKVKVYNMPNTEGGTKKDMKPIIITPNQKIVFEKITQDIKPLVVEQPIALSLPKSPASFVFQETPVLAVLQKLEEVYGLEIKPSYALKNCTFTGDLNDLELYTQLSLVCQSINAKYEKQGTTIMIIGNGCQ